MAKSNYQGVLESWEVKLMLRRAKRMGFDRFETDDAIQAIVLILLQRNESWQEMPKEQRQSLLPAIVDNQLCMFIRGRVRRQKREEKASIDAEASYGDDEMIRGVDVWSVVEELDQRQQVICQLLAEGYAITVIAKRIGLSWHSVKREIEVIRDIFKEAGLDLWLEK